MKQQKYKLAIYRIKRAIMETFGREKKKVDEISFVLQNIFIVHPNPGSKYKIRVVVNRNNRQQPFKKVNNRYTFQMPASKDLPNNSCFMVLLEKTSKKGMESQYLEIGKGELELSDVTDPNVKITDSIVNGVIYGTRSFNYDRIIGKYSYKISKSKVESMIKESRVQESKKISFVDHKKKQKIPDFAFKKSIAQHSDEINSKIKQLARSMNEIIGNSKAEEEDFEVHEGAEQYLPSIKEAVFEENDYFYKYNTKIEEQLKDFINYKDFKVMVIKNIRIEKEKQTKQTDESMVKPKNSKLQKHKTFQAMIIFYQLFQDKKLRKRLLEIYLSLSYGQDNRFLMNNFFYLPKSQKKVLIQIALVSTTYNKDRSLNGVIEPSHAKSRLIELLDTSDRERGIFICQIQTCSEIDKEEIKSYQKQRQKFQKYMKRYNCEFSHFVKKPQPVKQASQESVIIDNSAKDTLYSNFHPKMKVDPSRRNRYKTDVGRSIDLESIAPSVSRSKNNYSVLSQNTGKRRLYTKGSSFDFESKSKRGYPSDSQTVVGLKKQKFKDENFQDFGNRYRLYFQSVQLNLYGLDAKNKKVLLKFDINDQSQTKKIFFTSERQQHPLHLEYKGKKITESLTIFLLINRKNTTNYFKIGKCHILLSQFKNSTSKKFKVFITKQNKIHAYLILNFKMFRQKNSDEITQSFYYQEEYDRERSLISEGEKKYDNQAFDNFSETEIPFKHTVFDRNDEEEFQMSVGSDKISNAKNTEVHYISEKMSEKAPSEILEEQEYNQGHTIQKKQY